MKLQYNSFEEKKNNIRQHNFFLEKELKRECGEYADSTLKVAQAPLNMTTD